MLSNIRFPRFRKTFDSSGKPCAVDVLRNKNTFCLIHPDRPAEFFDPNDKARGICHGCATFLFYRLVEGKLLGVNSFEGLMEVLEFKFDVKAETKEV